MQWVNAIVSWLGGLRRIAGLQSGEPGARSTRSAKPVTFDTAMQVSAFWACVRLTADTIGSLPVKFYRIEGGRRIEDRAHPLFGVLAMKPNRYQTRVDFLTTMGLCLATWGNFYAQVLRNGAGEIVSLLPLMPSQVTVRLLSDGAIAYEYADSRGMQVFAESSVWHIKLMGNGITGLSPLSHAMNAIGIAQATEDMVSDVMRNGMKPSGVLMLDDSLTDKQRDAYRSSFRELAEGDGGGLIVLEKATDYKQLSMSPQDAELLTSRRFQVEDIARFMGTPSVLINDTSGTTAWGSGIQQIIEGWFKLGLRPYLENIELSAVVHLLPPADRAKWEIELDVDTLLRMDQGARFDAYQKAINAGVMTPNEARAQEGWDPAAGGDQLLVNGTMVPIDKAGQQSQPAPQEGLQ
jgi:HK97 family phage portal protein